MQTSRFCLYLHIRFWKVKRIFWIREDAATLDKYTWILFSFSSCPCLSCFAFCSFVRRNVKFLLLTKSSSTFLPFAGHNSLHCTRIYRNFTHKHEVESVYCPWRDISALEFSENAKIKHCIPNTRSFYSYSLIPFLCYNSLK